MVFISILQLQTFHFNHVDCQTRRTNEPFAWCSKKEVEGNWDHFGTRGRTEGMSPVLRAHNDAWAFPSAFHWWKTAKQASKQASSPYSQAKFLLIWNLLARANEGRQSLGESSLSCRPPGDTRSWVPGCLVVLQWWVMSPSTKLETCLRSL